MPLNFVTIDAGYSNLGEVPEAIPEIAFTTMIGPTGWLDQNHASVRKLLDGLIEATGIIHDPSQDSAVVPFWPISRNPTNLIPGVPLRICAPKPFPPRLEIPEASFKTTAYLMIKAGLLEESQREKVGLVFDPRYLADLAKFL